jgi:pSer/pThr/pTyr-binding forkhead associated (FHA) protein
METNTDKEPEGPETDDTIPQNAFLIIDGVKIQPLKEAVVNIGRRLENHVIIDDPRISRQHAQLRAIRGHYVLFDLNSTGGTFVNGQRTTQTVLYPNDVISLSGVILVYDQDLERGDVEETSPLSDPGSTAQPTATMEKITVDIEAVGNESPKHGDADAEDGTMP